MESNEVNHLQRLKYSVSWELHAEPPTRTNKRSVNTPSKRWGHSTALYRHYLYMFGGNLSNNFHSTGQSLFIFDLQAWGETAWDRFIPPEG